MGIFMLTQLVKRFPAKSLWFSLLLHLIILLIFISTLTIQQTSQPTPDSYVPSYVYHEEPAPQETPAEPVAVFTSKSVETSAEGIEKPVKWMAEPSIPKLNQLKNVVLSKNRETIQDEVNLIGDKKMDAPLLKLLAKALSAHLSYPKPAIDFNVRGVVKVGFMIYPDGHITHIQLVSSSSAGVLDKASLLAVQAMSPVMKVDSYLDQPKFLVVGIIFG